MRTLFLALAEYGYDDARIAEGRDLLETAIAARKKASVTLSNFLKLTRLRLHDAPGLLSQLGASEPRKKVYSEWVGQTRRFYEVALDNDDVMAALARYNVTRAKLQAGLDELETVVTLNSQQEDEKAETIEASAARRAAFEVLDDWMEEFLVVVDVALHDKPGARKRFGQNAAL